MAPESKKILPVPSLRNIQTFLEVANAGSISQAAALLNVTPSAVSHQLTSLEQFIGKKLLIRNGNGIVLTAVGKTYYQEISGAINTIGRATDLAINDIHHDILRLHSSPSLGLLWLMRRLNKFNAAHPEIHLNLTCSYENLHFTRDNIDIDIRHGYPDWPTLQVHSVKNEKMVALATPEYLSRHPVSAPDDLLNHTLIHSSSTLINWNAWFSWFNIPAREKNYMFSFDRSYMSFEAARMGIGVILESNLLAKHYLNEGILVPVFGEAWALPLSAHHIVLPHASQRKQKVSLFLDWFSRELQQEGFAL